MGKPGAGASAMAVKKTQGPAERIRSMPVRTRILSSWRSHRQKEPQTASAHSRPASSSHFLETRGKPVGPPCARHFGGVKAGGFSRPPAAASVGVHGFFIQADGWVLLAAAVVLAGHFAWWSDPLGLAPVLDGRELLLLARAMAAGTLPPEPFYRAPLYPAALAGCMQCGSIRRGCPGRRACSTPRGFSSPPAAPRGWRTLVRFPGSAALAAGLVGFYPLLHFFPRIRRTSYGPPPC